MTVHKAQAEVGAPGQFTPTDETTVVVGIGVSALELKRACSGVLVCDGRKCRGLTRLRAQVRVDSRRSRSTLRSHQRQASVGLATPCNECTSERVCSQIRSKRGHVGTVNEHP